MIVCAQCNGGKVVNVREALTDLSGNSQHFKESASAATPSACQQCRGTGVQYS
jgi:hypothetical protein